MYIHKQLMNNTNSVNSQALC